MATRNKALLLATIQKIRDNPGEWFQSAWVNSCGTSFCFAGHAAVLSGAEAPSKPGANMRPWLIQPDGRLDPVSNLDYGQWGDDWLTVQERGSVAVAEWAWNHLGITPDEATWLFDSTNTLEYLEDAVRTLVTGGSIEPETGNLVNSHGRTTYQREE